VLTLLGLFGVLFAGVAADAVMTPSTKAGNDDEDSMSEDQVDTSGTEKDLDDDPDDTDGFVYSDDKPVPQPDDLTITGTDTAEVISGGLGNDQIAGQGGADLIDGRAGDDQIDAGTGNDVVWGGEGDDTLNGATGDDTIEGQAGDDLILGEAGDDSLSGHSGNDSLDGGTGADSLLGGEGADTLSGGVGNDWLAGGYGDDRMSGGAGSDTLDGGAGNDWLSGLAGETGDLDADFLNGGAGNDTMVVGAGDHASGGEGDDDFILQDWLNEGGVAHISDYDADKDQLIVVYDPAAHPNPALTLEVSGDGQQTTILLDGSPVATIQGDMVQLDDIRLSAA
jgi:Ca2+-binding RTX toxin-like protein